jgi:AcrR family transcriptional regulator
MNVRSRFVPKNVSERSYLGLAMREPVQKRSREKVERIIAAAAAILASDEAPLTVRRLATTADVSPGTIYQFFPDIDAVAAAVRNAALERLSAKLEAEVPRELAAVPTVFFTRLIDAVEDLQRRHPETGCVARPGTTSAFTADLATRLRAQIHDHMLAAFAAVEASGEGLPLPARIDLAGSALLAVLARLPPVGAPDRAAHLAAAARVAAAALRD